MASCHSSSSLTIFDTAFSIWKTWQISVLVLLTMALQVLLVVAGMLRRHSPNRFIHLSIWFSFVAVDTVATYVLGLMVGASCDIIFSVWAPVVLFHLGAADSISAWSSSDNELWQRHGIKMSLEVLAVLYIIIRTVCRKFLVVGTLLFIIGIIKYAERISAMRSSSGYQLLKSAQPIYNFMTVEHEVADGDTHPLLVVGEREWYANHIKDVQSRSHHALSSTEAAVTYQDIVKCRELRKATDGYMSEVCLAYALYKVFKRRLTNLRIHQKVQDYQKITKLLKHLPPLKLMRVIDLELSFIFDGLFTKAAGSAYTQMGVLLRILSTILLIVAMVYLVVIDTLRSKCTDTSVHLAGVLTHVLLVVAVVLDTVQIVRMITSNSTKVWLGCTYVKQKRRSRRVAWGLIHKLNAKLILFIIPFVGVPKSVHWKGEIGQISIVNSCLEDMSRKYLGTCKLKRMFALKKMRNFLSFLNDVPCRDLELFVLEKLEVLRREIAGENFFDTRHQMTRTVGTALLQLAPEFPSASDTGLEHTILNWHIATSVCEIAFWQEQKDEKASIVSISDDLQKNKDAQMSVALSKYVLYLLVKCPRLLPVDRDVAILLYSYAKRAFGNVLVRHAHQLAPALLRDYKLSSEDPEALRGMLIDSGIMLGRQLLAKPAVERWKLLADVWCKILMLIALSEDAVAHTKQLARGGELLTHLWVLLGHMAIEL